MGTRLVGINHVALEVGDIDQALEFYGSLFDITLRGRGPSMAFIDMGDQFIALSRGRTQGPDDARQVPGHGPDLDARSGDAPRQQRAAPPDEGLLDPAPVQLGHEKLSLALAAPIVPGDVDVSHVHRVILTARLQSRSPGHRVRSGPRQYGI